MIARVWKARMTLDDAPKYAEHLRTVVVPSLQRLDGYRGLKLLQRQDGDEGEAVVVTWWATIDAIRGFAGADIGSVVVTDEAAGLLTSFDNRVLHFDVVLDDSVVDGQ